MHTASGGSSPCERLELYQIRRTNCGRLTQQLSFSHSDPCANEPCVNNGRQRTATRIGTTLATQNNYLGEANRTMDGVDWHGRSKPLGGGVEVESRGWAQYRFSNNIVFMHFAAKFFSHISRRLEQYRIPADHLPGRLTQQLDTTTVPFKSHKYLLISTQIS